MIPRRLHRIWLGPHRMPAQYVAHARQWEALGWPVHDWSEVELEQLPLSDETRSVLADIEENGANAGGGIPEVARWVQMADVYAYELVRCVGGVVANCDIEPLRDLPLADQMMDGFVVAENQWFLSNALMGACPDHQFWADLCATLPERFAGMRWAPMNESTGPHHLTARYRALRGPVPCLQPVPFMNHYDDERRLTQDAIRAACVDAGMYVRHAWGHQHPELLQEA